MNGIIYDLQLCCSLCINGIITWEICLFISFYSTSVINKLNKIGPSAQDKTWSTSAFFTPNKIKWRFIFPEERPYPLDTGRKLNVHNTFRRRPGRLLNVLCTFNVRPVPGEWAWRLPLSKLWGTQLNDFVKFISTA